MVARLGLARRWLRVWPARLFALIALALALGALGLVRLLLHRVAFARTRLDLGLGLRYGDQALVAPRDLRRHVQPIVDGTAVAFFGRVVRIRSAPTPIQALQTWHREKPDFFVKRVYKHPGIDMSSCTRDHLPKRAGEPYTQQTGQMPAEMAQRVVAASLRVVNDAGIVRDGEGMP